MNKYVCFYTDRSFWAKEKPGFDYLINNRESFNNEFSEQIYKYYNNIFYFGVCRDGLIVTRINKLESDRDEMLSPENTSPYSFDQFISRYLIYENAIQLLFCSSYFKKTGWDLGFVSLHSGDTLTFIEDNGKLICDMFPQNSKYTKYYTDRFSNGVVINPFEIPHYFSCSDVALDENTVKS